MQKIIPAIIPESFQMLSDTLKRIEYFVHEVQVDIVDGRFVSFTSWPYTERSSVSELKTVTDKYKIEIDLMIQNPEGIIAEYIQAGVQKIVVHLESVTDIEKILKHHEMHEYALGFSINNDTPLEVLTQYIDEIDYIQLMGIRDIGSQGQPFDERVLTRIEDAKTLFPEIEISIDGSVNIETLPRLVAAGADRFVSGSAILKAGDPKQAFDTLTTATL